MKYRNGFVSNSSSSSFVIGLKKGVKLKDALGKLKAGDHPFGFVLNDIIDAFISESKKKSTKDIFKEYYVDSMEDFLEDGDSTIVEIWKRGFDLYTGSFSDEEGGMEAYLCNTGFDYESEDMIILKDGGY